ncbi:unknown [Clostridium sp. CAG:729]|nr:unknown [Clostridium sp. CAG:729]
MATMLLFSNTITDTYKQTSEAVNSVSLSDKIVVKKTLVEIMKQSFFHGPNRFGRNFIA